MRTRLRPMPSPAELARLYATPHDHTRWHDHLLRVNVSTILARDLLRPRGHVIDLSCGDAAIARNLERSHGATLTLGDLAPGYPLTGPIEETIDRLPHNERGVADLFVCSETLEHLDDPDVVLRKIRGHAARLLISTPLGEADDANPEHVWGWDRQDVQAMLEVAGFKVLVRVELDLRPAGFTYCYGIWGCE